ncbi:MAG: addiction module protein [Planctomycetes bacterium]|nr:addiction module protein [Planctomycetota bacterium]
MAAPVSLADVLNLSVAERIQLVEDIWDSIAAVPESVPLTDAQREELDCRLDAYHRDPAAGAPWEEVRERILTA